MRLLHSFLNLILSFLYRDGTDPKTTQAGSWCTNQDITSTSYVELALRRGNNLLTWFSTRSTGGSIAHPNRSSGWVRPLSTERRTERNTAGPRFVVLLDKGIPSPHAKSITPAVLYRTINVHTAPKKPRPIPSRSI